MSLRLSIALILSILAIGLLIIDQDQFAMFFGTRTAVVSIVFVSGCGALTALSVESDGANLFAKRVEAFARGSVLSAVVAVFVGWVAMLANIDDYATRFHGFHHILGNDSGSWSSENLCSGDDDI